MGRRSAMAAKAQSDGEDDDLGCAGPWCSTPSSRSRKRWISPSPFDDLAGKGSGPLRHEHRLPKFEIRSVDTPHRHRPWRRRFRMSSSFLSSSHSPFLSADSQSFIGVNYGQVADNLPSPSNTTKLLQSTAIKRVRLYGADPTIIKAFACSSIAIAMEKDSVTAMEKTAGHNFKEQERYR